MSRALTIDATLDRVTATCARLGAPISTVETLPRGLIRIALRNADAAANVARAYAKCVVTSPLARTLLVLSSQGMRITQR